MIAHAPRVSPIGRATVATPGALALLARFGVEPTQILMRLAAGDWGQTSAADRPMNDAACRGIGRLRQLADRVLAVYQVGPDASSKVWAITEHDLSVTTILLPEEY